MLLASVGPLVGSLLLGVLGRQEMLYIISSHLPFVAFNTIAYPCFPEYRLNPVSTNVLRLHFIRFAKHFAGHWVKRPSSWLSLPWAHFSRTPGRQYFRALLPNTCIHLQLAWRAFPIAADCNRFLVPPRRPPCVIFTTLSTPQSPTTSATPSGPPFQD